MTPPGIRSTCRTGRGLSGSRRLGLGLDELFALDEESAARIGLSSKGEAGLVVTAAKRGSGLEESEDSIGDRFEESLDSDGWTSNDDTEIDEGMDEVDETGLRSSTTPRSFIHGYPRTISSPTSLVTSRSTSKAWLETIMDS